MKRILLILIITGLLSACNSSRSEMESVSMPANISIQSIEFEKSFFKPSDRARWTLTIATDAQAKVVLVSQISHLDQQLVEVREELNLTAGGMEIQLSWQPPAESPRGYGLDIRVESLDGGLLAAQSSAFDVLEVWTQNPRYGFMTDFSPNRLDGEQAIESLKRFHINGLQFYDWMYRHDSYLPPEDPFTDPLGRKLSLATTRNLIEIAHLNGMAAMPYTAVYAASVPFFEQHRDWALFESNGDPSYFGENFLVIMDPRPGSPWTLHLLDQFDQILQQTDFDGIHLDQYGAPKKGYDAQGNSYELDQPLADLIDSTAAVVENARGGQGAVIFNAVTNWPIETVAPAKESVVYIEVWPPYTSFNDLNTLIRLAQKLGDGKPVVIAAYIHPRYETNARLNDAVIFASGAGHIELGEGSGYLADPYFPKYEMPSAELSAVLQRYYEFAIRYQDVLGPSVQTGNMQTVKNISLEGVSTSVSVVADKVMPIVRESGIYTAVNLVNLAGLEHGEWEKELSSAPTAMRNVGVKIKEVEREVARVWFASPDRLELALQPVDFQQDAGTVSLTLPSLHYWSLILIEWSH